MDRTEGHSQVRSASVVNDVDLPERGSCRVRRLHGPPNVPTVLLLHGWTATADLNWGRCYGPLAEHFEVVSFDQRGHGRGIRGRFSLEACADDAAALLVALGTGPAILAGYSMGGPVATLLWRRHPELVAGMVLCSTAPYFAATRLEQLALAAVAGCSVPARRLPPCTFQALRALARLGRSRMEAGLPQAALDLVGRHDLAAICQAARALLAYRAEAWLGSVSVPAAVVMTTQDHLVPPDRQLRLAAAIPGCALYRVEGDHAVCATSPARFLPAMLDALDNVAGRALALSVGAGRAQPMVA
jgi:3-oxoadipate enol-lactonase